MSEQDYEHEVKTIYPESFVSFDKELKAGSVYRGYFDTPFGKMPKALKHLLSEDDHAKAWELAYLTLKQQQKL